MKVLLLLVFLIPALNAGNTYDHQVLDGVVTHRLYIQMLNYLDWRPERWVVMVEVGKTEQSLDTTVQLWELAEPGKHVKVDRCGFSYTLQSVQ